MPRKKKKIKKREIKKRSLRAADKQIVRKLAAQLAELIPFSGKFGRGLNWTNIISERRLSKYLPKKYPNKTEALTHFLERLIVYKPKTLHKLLRDNLGKAIDNRLKKGQPLLQAEALALVQTLEALDIKMRKEILELKLPEKLPAILPPRIEIQNALNNLLLHALLLPECKELFLKGHINESVRKAAEKFEVRVQGLSGVADKIGRDLMANAFSETNPKIKLNGLITANEKNEQEGFKLISMGVMAWWRNTTSHGDEPQMAPLDGLSRLLTISNLLHILDERTKVA